MSRPSSRALLWLALSILLISVFVAAPNYIPGAVAAAYAGPEPTPTNLTAFLHNNSVSLPITGGITSPTVATTVNDTANPWSDTGQMVTGLHNLNAPSFYLFPRLAGALYLNGTPTADIFVNQTGAVTTGTWTFYLYAVDSSGVATLLGSGATPYSSGYNVAGTGYPLRISLAGPIHMNLSAGESLYASFSQTQGNNQDAYGFWWGDVRGTYYTANVNLPSSTYLTVSPAYLLGPDGIPTASLNQSVRTPIASLRANLTDPLGNYDYSNWSVTWKISNATGIQVASGMMTPIGPSVPPLFYGFNETYAAPFNYSTLPAGQYSLCANATDNTYHNDVLFGGNYFGRAASDCATFFIGSAPYLVSIHVLDSKHIPLRGAVVYGAGEANTTDASGLTHLHFPNGSIPVTVKWEGIQVISSIVNVSGPTGVTLLTAVFYPTLSIEDSTGGALSDALVYLVHPNGTEYPLMRTNQTGNLSLTQVPGGTFGITVIWHDSVVYTQANPQQPAIDVAGNGAYAVETQVYPQSFQVIQPTGTPVPLASVVVRNSTTGVLVSFGITNATGTTSSQVPGGTFDVLVYWQTSLIASLSDVGLPSAQSPYVITASLYSVTFQAVDSAENQVSGAVITVSGVGGPITNLVTGTTGTATLILPGGTYQVSTSWEGTVVNTTSVTITGVENLTLDLAIYYLTVVTQDSSGTALSGVFLQVISNSTGNYVGSATSGSQPTVFRLALGGYQLVASYHGTYGFSSVSQTLTTRFSLTSSKIVVLKFTDVNPPFTSTPEFLVIVVIVVLLAILVAVLARLFRRKRAAPAGARAPEGAKKTPEEKKETGAPEKAGETPPGESAGTPDPEKAPPSVSA